MAALLPVLRIKRDNGYGAVSLVVKPANKHKELLLLMPKWATRSLLDILLFPCFQSMADWPCLQPLGLREGTGVSLTCLPDPSVLLCFAPHR